MMRVLGLVNNVLLLVDSFIQNIFRYIAIDLVEILMETTSYAHGININGLAAGYDRNTKIVTIPFCKMEQQ